MYKAIFLSLLSLSALFLLPSLSFAYQPRELTCHPRVFNTIDPVGRIAAFRRPPFTVDLLSEEYTQNRNYKIRVESEGLIVRKIYTYEMNYFFRIHRNKSGNSKKGYGEVEIQIRGGAQEGDPTLHVTSIFMPLEVGRTQKIQYQFSARSKNAATHELICEIS